MEREQHIIQDAAELYAVFVMQRQSESLGRASAGTSHVLWSDFVDYLNAARLALDDFESGKYSAYKANADLHLPAFVDRLADHLPGSTLDFENVEKEFRNLGMKGDFVIAVGGKEQPIPVSLKNYTGSGGILRPQVASGTFASFAASFIFERVGVGTYADPRRDGAKFSGRDTATRTKVLNHLGLTQLVAPLAILDRLQADVQTEFLSDECEFYDQVRVRAAVERIAPEGIAAVLEVFDALSLSRVRDTFLARIGLDGKEEALFFDSERYVDSITNAKFHKLRARLNDQATEFQVLQHKQNLRFSFQADDLDVLVVDVPFTINTNGAWYRPKERFTGTQRYNDKGHWVELKWGQRRPYKSKEIATSVNTYVNLSGVGIFGE